MILFYNFVLFVFFIPAIAVLLLSDRKRSKLEVFYKCSERFGIFQANSFPLLNDEKRPLLWVHCASIGEVRAVEPLIRELKEFSFLLTTHTLSGRQYAENNNLAQIICYAPIDFSFIVNKFISRFKPKGIMLVETELWPGMIYTAKKNKISTILINARMSSHSYPFYKGFGLFWKHVVNKIDCLSARSQIDADRFIKIGYPAEKAVITGNIKYDRDIIIDNFSRSAGGFKESDFIIAAGSTRPGEEEILVTVWENLKDKYPNLKLIIAPRHINRINKIKKLLINRQIKFKLRSNLADKNNFDCLLIDTFGELMKFYSIADVTFVGGSLVNKGGQNPIEPASCSKPVFFGNYMDNFLSEAISLENSGGGIRIKNIQDFIIKLDVMLGNMDYRIDTGKKALAAVTAQKGAVDKTVQIINSLFSLQPGLNKINRIHQVV